MPLHRSFATHVVVIIALVIATAWSAVAIINRADRAEQRAEDSALLMISACMHGELHDLCVMTRGKR